MSESPTSAFFARLRLSPNFGALMPGFAVSVVIAITSQFLSDHYGAPAMLMALLLGIAFHFLAEEGRCVAGINVTSRTVLRLGVALLGARISVEMAQTVVAEDDEGQRLPAWFLVEVARDLPRLAERKAGK